MATTVTTHTGKYTPSFSGGVQRTLAAKLEDIVSVKDFGAVGDDPGDGTGTDDTSAIQAAFTWAAANGRTITGGDSIYRIANEIEVLGPAKSFAVDRLRLRMTGNEQALHIGDNGADASTTLAADVRATAKSFTVADATGFAAGKIIRIVSNKLWPYDNRTVQTYGEINAIESVDGTTIYLAAQITSGYDVDTDTVTVSVYTPVEFSSRLLEVKYPTVRDVVGCRLSSLLRCTHEQLRIAGARATGLSLSSCFRAKLDKPWINGANLSGSGYGIQVNQCSYTDIAAPDIYDCRRPVDDSGSNAVSRHTKVSGGVLAGLMHTSDGSAVGNHGGSDHMTVDGVTLIGGASSVVVRGSNMTIQNCTMMGPIVEFVTWNSGPGLRLINNKTNLQSSDGVGVANANIGSGTFLNISAESGVEDAQLWPSQALPFVIEGNAVVVRTQWMKTGANVSKLRYGIIRGNTCIIQNNSGGTNVYGINNAATLALPYGMWGEDAVLIRVVVGTYTAFLGTVNRSVGTYGYGRAPLTENSGAIGGTNDGNLPDLSGTPDTATLVAALRELAARVNAIDAT